MNAQRLRAILVTIALVLGAGTMSAVAAPILRGEGAVESTPTETATDVQTEAATEAPTEPADNPTEAAPREERKAKATAQPKTKREIGKPDDAGRKTAKQGGGRPPWAGGPPPWAGKASAAGGEGRGNAHGKAVSDAARGVTPPKGECRNHGHWVSTVAKGLDSCDKNPRPADGADD